MAHLTLCFFSGTPGTLRFHSFSCRPKRLSPARNCVIAGKDSPTKNLPQEVIDAIWRQYPETENIKKAFRIFKDGQVYFSKEYSAVLKRISYVVLAVYNDNCIVCAIHYFLIIRPENYVFAVASVINRKKEWTTPMYTWKITHLMRVENERYINSFMQFHVTMPSITISVRGRSLALLYQFC